MYNNEIIVSYQNLFCQWMKIKQTRMADYFETFSYQAARFVNSEMEISRDDRAAEALLRMLGRLDFQCFSQDYPNRERESLVQMGMELYKHDFISKQDLAIIRSRAKETFLDKITQLQQKGMTISKDKLEKMKRVWQKCIGFAPCDVWNWLADKDIQHQRILNLYRYALIFRSQAPLNLLQVKYFDTLRNNVQQNLPFLKEHQSAIEKLLRKIARTTSYYLEYKESISQQPADCNKSYDYSQLSQSFEQREGILLFCSLIQLWATRSDIINDRHRDSGMNIRGVVIMSMFYLLETNQIIFSINSEPYSSQEYKMLPLQSNFFGFLRFYGEKGAFRKRKMISSMVKDCTVQQFYREDLIINIYDHQDRSNPGKMTKKYEQVFNYTFLMAQKTLCSKDINKIQAMFGIFES